MIGLPKIVDHDAYRRRLLEGALPLFADRGYDRLAMREIARAVGVSTGTLYHYFDSKQDLFLRLVEHLTDRLADAVVAASDGSDPRDRLSALLEHAAAHEQWYAAYNRLCLDYLRERDERGAGVMAATMRRATSVLADALHVDHPTARFALVALFGLITQRDLDAGATPFTEQAGLLLDWFDARVGRRDQPSAHPSSSPATSPSNLGG